MTVPGFYNSYELRLDAKNRIVIPADQRRLIDPEVHGSAFFVIFSCDRRPWLYPEKYYKAVYSVESPPNTSPDEKELRKQRRTLSLADLSAWDEQGRMVLPERILTRANIEKEVTLAGVWDHLELWNRADWNNYVETL